LWSEAYSAAGDSQSLQRSAQHLPYTSAQHQHHRHHQPQQQQQQFPGWHDGHLASTSYEQRPVVPTSCERQRSPSVAPSSLAQRSLSAMSVAPTADESSGVNVLMQCLTVIGEFVGAVQLTASMPQYSTAVNRCCADARYLFTCSTFLRAKATTLSARLSHRNSVRLSARLSVTRVDQSKTVQARITKFSPSVAQKTLVLGSVKLFHKFERGHSERGR